jgi:hypothetical protein
VDKDDKPLKMKVDLNKHQYVFDCDSDYGPTFGFFSDICIAKNSNTTMDSFSKLGYSYKHPYYECEAVEALTFLAGSFRFQLDEIEVYQKEQKRLFFCFN